VVGQRSHARKERVQEEWAEGEVRAQRSRMRRERNGEEWGEWMERGRPSEERACETRRRETGWCSCSAPGAGTAGAGKASQHQQHQERVEERWLKEQEQQEQRELWKAMEELRLDEDLTAKSAAAVAEMVRDSVTYQRARASEEGCLLRW